MSQQSLQQKLLSKNSGQNKVEEPNAPLTEKQEKVKDEYFKKKHYLFGENIFESIFFTWISPLLRYGYRIDLQQKSIPFLREKDLPRIDLNKLEGTFKKKVQNNKSKRQGLTLVRSIFSAFKKQFITLLILAFTIVSLQMYQPILSHDVIAYIAQQQRTLKTGIIYFLIIFSLTIFLSISQNYMWYYFGILGFNLSNTLSLIIYNKALKYPMITQKQFQVSQIINYSQVDAQRLTYLGFQMVAILYTPLQIIVGLTLLYLYIGISFLVGLGVMILLMCCTLIFTKIATTGNDQLLKAKDARMKVAQQILQIIKFIKINALEKYFFQKINRKRQNQLRLSKKVNLCYVATIFLYWLCPPTIVSFTFLAYVSMGNQISAAKAFFTIIIFNLLQYPIRLLPTAITQLIQIWSSIKRIQKFMVACQLNQDCIEQNTQNSQKYAIQIKKGNFMWGKEKQKDQKKKKQQEQKKKQGKSDKKIQQSEQSEKSKQTKQNEIMEKISDLSNSIQITHTMSQDQLKQSLLSQGDKSMIQKQKQSKKQEQKKKQEQYTKTLKDININFPSKQVTMIIGDIGSGKSSLLYAILNQMTPQPQKQSKIIINGSIAYSPQKAWIMTGTVKQNILFFQPYDQERFKNAIHYSCLSDDLKILSKGIQTDIGEKGVNLSGGQKARISLARALYSNKDIYLLDDILSAVDVHVGKFIMQQTILQYLRGKTVIMPTHAVKYLQKADNIIIMKKGKVVQNGPYKHISDTQQFLQIMNLLKKKQQQHKNQKNQSKQQQQIVNQLKLVKQATISKQKQKVQQQNKNQQISYTNKIVDQLIMPQDHKKGEVSLQVYKQYIQLNGGPFFVIIVLFCMSTWAVLSILSNIQVQQWCQDENKQKYHLYLYLVFAISATLFSGTRAYILVTGGIKQGRTIHKKVIKALLYASITTFYNRVPVGRILNRMSKDLRQIDESIGYSVGSMLVCFFCMISSLVMCLYASTIFVIFPILLVGIICRFTLRYYLKSQRQCVRLQNITNSPIVSGFTSAINGVGTIRAYNLSAEFLNLQIQRIDTNKRMKIARQAMQSWFSLRLALLSFLINMSALAYSILSNNENASLAGLLLTYSSLLNDDIIGFAFSYAGMQLRMISIQRVSTFTKLQPQPAYKQYCQKWRTKQQGANLLAIQNGSIQFNKYSARYRQGLPLVIKQISLKIQKAEKVGVVGRTGAGKSTLISCLLRILQADSGKIIIDGKNITQYSLKDLRSCITMIEQQPTLMNGTFRDNLDPAHQYSDQQIFNILKECNLSELVETKGGLNAKVTNDNLSVGEKQLLCICRAFLKKSKIILIDQATANIDVKNDKLIQQVIAIAFKNSTVLTIAHRLTTLQNCDKILVLGQGKILQWGYTKDLLQKPNGIYKKMWEQNDSTYLH